MRCVLPILALAAIPLLWGWGEGDPAVSDTVARISAAERRLPWFWSPTAEGLSDTPYTYQVVMTRRILRGGREVLQGKTAPGALNFRTLQLERIPLDWGAFMRCLSVDDASPCREEWNREFDRQVKSRDSLGPEVRQRIDGVREERRQRRRAFWDDFPLAYRFVPDGANQLRFSPVPGHKPKHSRQDGMLTALSGRLTFDPATGEIVRFEYDFLRDVNEPFVRLPKGAHFEVELTRVLDGHYFPQRIFTRQQSGKAKAIEERTDVFSNFRRFASDSKLEFGEPKGPGGS
jgi:hypothetical protein